MCGTNYNCDRSMEMMEKMASDQALALKLDADYIDYLAMIRPYMEAIPDTAQLDVQQCRVWLHRLTNGPASDRRMRNEYMAELCRQLQSGKLGDPFCFQPPPGPLQIMQFDYEAFKEDNKDTSSLWSDVTETTQCASIDWQTITEGSSLRGSARSLVPSPLTTQRSELVDHASCLTQRSELVDHASCLQVQRNLEDRIADLQGQVNRCQRAMEYCVPNNKSKDGLPRIDDLDSKLGSLYEKKLQSMVATIDKLKHKNDTLNKEVAQYKRTLALGTSTATSSITNLNKEISALSIKIAELEKIKGAMESNHQEVEAEHKRLVAGHLQDLSNRLTEAEKLNFSLQDSLQKTLDKSHKLEAQLADQETNINKYWEEKLLKEAGTYTRKIDEMERNYSTQIHDLQTNKNEMSTRLADQSKEIKRLNEVINEQCLRIKDEMLNFKKEKDEEKDTSWSKVAELKRVISDQRRTIKKLETSKSRAVNDYERKLIQSEIDTEAVVRKLTFENSTQRAKLAVSLNRGELDNEIMLLEERYKHLFDDMVETSLRQRQEDLKKIRDLEDMLLLTPQAKRPSNCRSVMLVTTDNNTTEGKSVTIIPIDVE